MKKLLNHVFIDGLGGMALGLFCTLIFGTILQQLGTVIEGDIGEFFFTIGNMIIILTGAGIGCGVARKYEAGPLVLVSAAAAGMVGAFADKIIDGSVMVDGVVHLSGPGEPLGAFIAAFVAIEIGNLIAGKTQVDIILLPLVCIGMGALTGILICPSISNLMLKLGELINWSTQQQPIVMGIVVSVVMGMALTLPISSAALGVILGLKGLAAGAATVGCCANMIGFAIASYRENQVGGLLAQGLGTSMLQMPNILKRPQIWLPAIISSAILGPISTCVVKMTNTAVGCGMGSAGLVGQVTTYEAMAPKTGSSQTILLIIAMQFILPGLISLVISEGLRKLGLIKEGDMKLNL